MSYGSPDSAADTVSQKTQLAARGVSGGQTGWNVYVQYRTLG